VEKIYIENFGGIKKMDFEFKSINVLIGPQGVGKSITVKLMYFFKSFIDEIAQNIESEESKRDLDTKHKETFTTFFPKESWGKYNSVEISLNRVGNKLLFNYSSNLKSLIIRGKKIYKAEKEKVFQNGNLNNFSKQREISNKISQFVREELGNISTYRQFFIPAGRSFFANIQSSIFSFLSDNRSLDPFLIEFGSFYESLKLIYSDIISNEKQDKEFDDLISQILKSNYVREKEKDYLVHKDNRKINLTNASSGQQETLPLIIILKSLMFLNSRGNGYTLYIEEPEAHLFPTAQKRIVQLLARTFNQKKIPFQLFVTTHSPYILSAFNNLIYAGNINKGENKKELVNQIISLKEQLQSEDFAVYSMDNYSKSNLMSDENQIISQSILDSVSEELSLEFGKLLDVEFNNEL
jgi:predicted ATPase